MKLIVGLGNPGERYAGTRHNVGFEVIDALASRHGIGLTREKFHAWFGEGEIAGQSAVLLKPTTFMNRCGQVVQAAGRFYKLELTDFLVVTDDMALPVGRLRMRAKGSSGGHNGLHDIVERLGSEDWCRLRIGVGEALGDWVSFVLTRFDSSEEAIMQKARDRAADAIESWIENGPEVTMTRFNGEVPQE